MAEPKSKNKSQPGMREAKPKKKLGLVVPAPLRMPHLDLFPADQPEDAPGVRARPVSESDRPTFDTGNINEPVPETNRTVLSTGSNTAPASDSNRSIPDTGPNLTPVQNQPRSENAIGSGIDPVAERDQYQNRTGAKSRPVSKTTQSRGQTGLNSTPASSKPASDLTPAANPNRSIHTTGPFLPPVVEPNQYIEPSEQFFKTPNTVSDVIQQRLTDEEFSLYFRLFRLSHGYKKTTCFVGYSALARALKWSLSKVKRIMPALLASGYVRVVDSYNAQELKGTVYEVFTGTEYKPVSVSDRSELDPGSKIEPNKLDDDHDYKENPHQSSVMKIYTELTGKRWTKADTAQYERLTAMTADEIELCMRRIHSRASQQIGSFAFFVRSIENEQAEGGQQSKAWLEKRYREAATEQAANLVGANIPISERVARFKDACIRLGLTWDNDLANKILNLD